MGESEIRFNDSKYSINTTPLDYLLSLSTAFVKE